VRLGNYLARLVAEATAIINVPEYAKTVRDFANRRRMIDLAQDCAASLKMAPSEITPEAIVADNRALDGGRRVLARATW
jgi:replicative DNA helicase